MGNGVDFSRGQLARTHDRKIDSTDTRFERRRQIRKKQCTRGQTRFLPAPIFTMAHGRHSCPVTGGTEQVRMLREIVGYF